MSGPSGGSGPSVGQRLVILITIAFVIYYMFFLR